jgi:uncharacterized protein YcgL (UPF0745 family)
MDVTQIVRQLIDLYQTPFGGKPAGRFRISMKLLQKCAGRKRLFSDEIEEISREIYQQGYILIDMDTYFVLLSQSIFRNYRRVTEQMLTAAVSNTGDAKLQETPTDAQ